MASDEKGIGTGSFERPVPQKKSLKRSAAEGAGVMAGAFGLFAMVVGIQVVANYDFQTGEWNPYPGG